LRYLKSASNVRCPAGCATTLPRTLPAVNVLLRGRLERQFGPQLAQRRKDVEHDRKLGLIPELPSANGASLGGGAAVHMAPAIGPVAVDFVADPAVAFDNNPQWDAMTEQWRKAARQTYMRMTVAIMMALLAYWMVPLPTLNNSLGDVSNVKL